jgi:hypothetical protein
VYTFNNFRSSDLSNISNEELVVLDGKNKPLAPWFNDADRRKLEDEAKEYKTICALINDTELVRPPFPSLSMRENFILII